MGYPRLGLKVEVVVVTIERQEWAIGYRGGTSTETAHVDGQCDWLIGATLAE